MITFRTTTRLFVLVCVLGLVIWMLERRRFQAEPGRERIHKVFEGLGDTSYVAFERGDMRVVCRRVEGIWKVTVPVAARAEEAEVERILSILDALPRLDVVTPAQRCRRGLTLEDYGLVRPQARVVLGNRLERFEMLVGRMSPLEDSLYIKLGADEDVLETSLDLLEALPASVEAMRDRRVLRGDVFRTRRIEIQPVSGGFLRIVRAGGAWHLQQPLETRADASRVEGILETLYGLQAESFVWDPGTERDAERTLVDLENEARSRAETHGLSADMAVARITVWEGREETGRELILGRSPAGDESLVFARRREGNTIYAVPRRILDALTIERHALRDRRLFPFEAGAVRWIGFQREDRKLSLHKDREDCWRISEPVDWPADSRLVEQWVAKAVRFEVRQFLDAPATNLAAYGLDVPAFSIEMGAGTLGEGRPSETRVDVRGVRLQFGIPDEQPARAFARLAGGDSVFEVHAEDFSRLVPRLTDPLLYRDRTMLALAPESVQRVSITRDEEVLGIERASGKRWVAVRPPGAAVAQEVVDDLLLVVSNLRATNVEHYGAADLAPYGLEDSRRMVTLGLRGDEGIQKTLIFGHDASPQSVFAMIQGQDVVFTLDRSLHGLLMRSPFVAAEGANLSGIEQDRP